VSDEDEVFAPEKDSGGRPPHEPTEQSRKFVKSMLGTGLKQPAVCAVLDISENTLRKHYPRELESAEFEVHPAATGTSFAPGGLAGNARFSAIGHCTWIMRSCVSSARSGDVSDGRAHFDKAMALYDPAAHRALAARFESTPGCRYCPIGHGNRTFATNTRVRACARPIVRARARRR
jgi:hypothetical protein